jgi:hypothetical protein
MNEPNNSAQTLQAIEGYLASHADRGDEAARALRAQLVELLTPEDPSESLPAPVAIEHWNSPKYGGDAAHLAGVTFSAQLVDELDDYGRLQVTVSDDNGLGEPKMAVALEVANIPGSTTPAAALLLYGEEEYLATIFRQPQGHLIVPMKPGMQILPSKLPDGQTGWLLRG